MTNDNGSCKTVGIAAKMHKMRKDLRFLRLFAAKYISDYGY